MYSYPNNTIPYTILNSKDKRVKSIYLKAKKFNNTIIQNEQIVNSIFLLEDRETNHSQISSLKHLFFSLHTAQSNAQTS